MAINGLTINTYTPGIVSGSELEQISREIFGAAPKAQTQAQSSSSIGGIDFSKIKKPSQGIELLNADVQIARQIAANQSGLNVNLSTNAISAIESLKAQAATSQVKIVDKVASEGKLSLPGEVVDVISVKEVFSAAKPSQIFESGTSEKDRKGSNPFSFYSKTVMDKKVEDTDSINIFG